MGKRENQEDEGAERVGGWGGRGTRQGERRGDQKQRELEQVISVLPHLTPSRGQASDALRGPQDTRGTHHHLANSKLFIPLWVE